MISEIIQSFIQILVFSFIPFIVFLFRNKTSKYFLKSIGIKNPTLRSVKLAVLFSLIFALPILLIAANNSSFLKIMHNPESITGKIRQMGLSLESIISLFTIALFQTAAAEEIFFRGFLAKGLINKFGHKIGNVIQAVIFGILHLAMFLIITNNIYFLFYAFVVPAIIAYIIVEVNERIGNGSILPGIIMHGISNVLSYSIIGFYL